MVAVNLITADKTTTIAEQGTPALEVSGAKVKQMLNEVSSASLSFPATNKVARSLLGTNRPVIEILDGNERVFYGAVVSATKDIFGNVNIECDGAMSFLSDIVKDPFSVNNRTPANYLETIITQYNAAASDERKVWFGGASGFESYGNVNIAHSDEFTDTLTLVKELVEIYGGYIVETYGSGATHPYIGWIKTINADSGRVLEFGVNELTLDNKLDFSEYASRVYAHGSGNLTKTVTNTDAEAAWGRRDLAYKSNAETQSELDAEAAAILASVSTPIQSIELTALDLEQLGHNYSGFVLGTTAMLLDAHFGINTTVMVNTVERDLLAPQNSKIVLGRASATLTNSLLPDAPQSRIAYIAENGGDGGSSAVTSVNGKTGAVLLKTSDLQNDSGYITSAPVTSVNGKTGIVVLSASDVGAMPDNYVAPVTSVNGQTGVVALDADDVGALADDAPVVTYAAQQLTEAQKAQARANIGAIADAVSDVIYDIYAEFVSHASGDYYNFTGGVNASTILSAINRGMLPIVRNNHGSIKRKWYFADYNDDGEDVYIQFFRETRYGTETMMFTESEGKAYVLHTNLSQFARKPVTVWNAPNVENGLIALNTNISSSLAWQLTDLNLSPFKRIKIYAKAGRKTGATAADSSIVPAAVIEMLLDDRAKETVSQNVFIGSAVVQNPNDANRLGMLTCAVSGDKTKFAVVRATSLYGTAATSNTDCYQYVFKIEGYYD